MTRAARQVAKEMADFLNGDYGDGKDHTLVGIRPETVRRWLLLLCPPRKRKVRSPGVKARRARLAPEDRRRLKKQCDELVREILFHRDDSKCRKCGRSDRRLNVSHVYPKGAYPWLRHDLDNVKLLCAAPCHMTWWHGHPEEAFKWWEKEIGTERMAALRARAGHPQKADLAAVKLALLQWRQE